MRKKTAFVLIHAVTAGGLMVGAGCASSPKPPQPEAPVNKIDDTMTTMVDKPMPEPPPSIPTTGFDDPAIVSQEMPEEPAFTARYLSVGSPRIMVFVNRAISGEQLPVAPGGTVHYSDGSTVYSPTGTVDDARARSIDYELIETLISGDMSCSNRVTMVSPIEARGRLSDAEVADLRSGRPQMLGEIAQKLQCDVLIRVSARPSEQTADGLGIRLIAEAMNVQAGQQLAVVAVDVPPPLIKTKLNNYCRYVSRKLMTGMTSQWARVPTGSMGSPAVSPAASPAVSPAPVTFPVVPAPAPAPASPVGPPPVIAPMPLTIAPTTAQTAPAAPERAPSVPAASPVKNIATTEPMDPP